MSGQAHCVGECVDAWWIKIGIHLCQRKLNYRHQSLISCHSFPCPCALAMLQSHQPPNSKTKVTQHEGGCTFHFPVLGILQPPILCPREADAPTCSPGPFMSCFYKITTGRSTLVPKLQPLVFSQGSWSVLVELRAETPVFTHSSENGRVCQACGLIMAPDAGH